MGVAIVPDEKPRYRPAQAISEEEGDEAIASGDPMRIHYALIDGSRCLEDTWALKYAWDLITHPDSYVRWAAAFALDQTRASWVPTLAQDYEAIHILDRLVADDPDQSVRRMVATTMTDVISMLVPTTPVE
jgi:HEAT repeat protein